MHYISLRNIAQLLALQTHTMHVNEQVVCMIILLFIELMRVLRDIDWNQQVFGYPWLIMIKPIAYNMSNCFASKLAAQHIPLTITVQKYKCMSSANEIKKHNKRHLELQKYEVINTDLISEFRKSDRFRSYFVRISKFIFIKLNT